MGLNNIIQGLIVSALGLGITFAALTVIILVISLLTRVFQPKPEAEAAAGAEPAAVETEEDEAAVAIAIALSIMRAGGHGRNGLGAALENGRGAWWRAARARGAPISRRAK